MIGWVTDLWSILSFSWISINTCWVGEPNADPDMAPQILARYSPCNLSFTLPRLAWEFRIVLLQILAIELALHFVNLQSIVALQDLLSIGGDASTSSYIYLLVNMALWILRAHAAYWISSGKTYIQTTLSYLVHVRSIRLPPDETRDVSLTNLLVSDTSVVAEGLNAVVAAWRLPVEFLSALYLLWMNLSCGVLPCLATALLFRSASLYLSFKDGNLRTKWQESRDDRINLCQEAFSPPGCGTLARLGWTNVWVEYILRSRGKELTLLGNREWMRKIHEGIDYAQPVIVQFVALVTMLYTNAVDAASVVPISLMLGNVMAPVNQVTGVVLSLLESQSALQRLREFFAASPSDRPSAESDYKLDPSFSGLIVGVTGQKGRLLKSQLIYGKYPCTVYVPQSPKLLVGCGDTVEDNVLFGRPRDGARLLEAMRLACLSQVPLSQKVDTLSMGQGARVCLARAYYCILADESSGGVLLLEEPWLSLDATTAKDVTTNLLSVLQRSLSIIVITDHIDMLRSVLPADSLLIVGGSNHSPVHDGRVRNKALSVGESVSQLENHEKHSSEAETGHDVAASVPLQAYSIFLTYVGRGYTFLIMLLIGGIMASQQTLDALLPAVADARDWRLLRGYETLLLVFVVCNFGAFHFEVVGGLRGSKRLFSGFVRRASSLALSIGVEGGSDILGRLVSDVDVSDHTLTRTLGILWGAILYLCCKFGFMLWSSHYRISLLLLLLLVVAAFELIAARPFRPANRGARRRAAAALPPVIAAAQGSFDIRGTLLDYGADSWVATKFLAILCQRARWQIVEEACRSWLSLRLEVLGFILTAQTTFLRPVGDPILAGMLITAARAVSGVVQQLIHNCADIERDFVSVQRLTDPIPLTLNAVSVSAPQRVDDTAIIIRGVSAGYGESIVLRSVNLLVLVNEKVALIGPSGVGKTTLLNSILGAADITEGGISVFGLCPREASSRQLIQCIPHTPVLFRGSVRHNLDPQKVISDRLIYEALDCVGLSKKVREYLDTDASTVLTTAADRLRICLCRVVLARETCELKIVLLDECAGVFTDPIAKAFVENCLTLFRSQTVIMTTHRPFLTGLFDRTVTLG